MTIEIFYHYVRISRYFGYCNHCDGDNNKRAQWREKYGERRTADAETILSAKLKKFF